MAPLDNPAIPKGSTVLVSGVNGYLASLTADQFLHYGYNVRGTVRALSKGAWMTKLFDEKYGKGRFELCVVEDMAAEGAFNEAIKGVSAVAHVASIMTFDSDPNNVVPIAISGALGLLKCAFAEPSVKRFVYTSSGTTAILPTAGRTETLIVTEETWNETAIKEAWADPPYGPERAMAVYAASKTQAEKAVFDFIKENQEKRPDFAVNSVVTYVNMGASLDLVNQGHASSSGVPVQLWNGDVSEIEAFEFGQHWVDAQDTARLHVAGAILPDVKNQRIFGAAGWFTLDNILDMLRKLAPNKKFIDKFGPGVTPDVIKPAAKAEQMLRDLGRPGWTSFEDMLKANMVDLVEAEQKA